MAASRKKDSGHNFRNIFLHSPDSSCFASTVAGLVSSLGNYQHRCCVPQSSRTGHAQLFAGACYIDTGQIVHSKLLALRPLQGSNGERPRGAKIPLKGTAKSVEARVSQDSLHISARYAAHQRPRRSHIFLFTFVQGVQQGKDLRLSDHASRESR